MPGITGALAALISPHLLQNARPITYATHSILMTRSSGKSQTSLVTDDSCLRCPRPHSPHLLTSSVTVLSALFPWDFPACPLGGPLRDVPPESPSSGSGPSCA